MSQSQADIRRVLKAERENLFANPNITGLGIGYKTIAGRQTETLCLICSVVKKLPPAELSGADLIPAAIEGVATDVFESGEIKAQQDPKAKIRPVPGGVSIGHRGVTAGTLGMWVRKNGEFHILSNNHVIADSNLADIGDDILQPGPYDSGVEKIAELSEFIRILFGGADNLVDAALARAVEVEDGGSSCAVANSIASLLNLGASGMGRKTRLKPVKVQDANDVVRDEILNIGRVTAFTEAQLGMRVKKMGRTTELTSGTVRQIAATIRVNYGTQSAVFVDQVVTSDMSQGGDSGSVVVTENDNQAIGLLFAGSDVMTVMNRFQNVVDALNFTLV